jgi:hypothetical protein
MFYVLFCRKVQMAGGYAAVLVIEFSAFISEHGMRHPAACAIA